MSNNFWKFMGLVCPPHFFYELTIIMKLIFLIINDGDRNVWKHSFISFPWTMIVQNFSNMWICTLFLRLTFNPILLDRYLSKLLKRLVSYGLWIFKEFKIWRNDIINTYDYYWQIMIMVINCILTKHVLEHQHDKGLCSLDTFEKLSW